MQAEMGFCWVCNINNSWHNSCMVVLGLTGGIASGKSSALKHFRKLGAATIDADEIVFEIYEKNYAKEMIALYFGKEVISKNKINRKALATKVFGNRNLLKQLNALVHPLVSMELSKGISRLRKKHGKKKLIVVEAALLFEARTEKMYDKVAVVYCPRKIQLQRLLKQGYSRKDADLRIRSQMPLSMKAKKADFVIRNEGSLKELRNNVEALFSKLSE